MRFQPPHRLFRGHRGDLGCAETELLREAVGKPHRQGLGRDGLKGGLDVGEQTAHGVQHRGEGHRWGRGAEGGDAITLTLDDTSDEARMENSSNASVTMTSDVVTVAGQGKHTVASSAVTSEAGGKGKLEVQVA